MIEHAALIQDVKQRKLYFTQVIEESLTKRPYAKHVLLFLLQQGNNGSNAAESVKLAKEVFKQVTSEDLYYLALHQGAKLAEFDRIYSEIGEPTELDNELKRTLLRYANEGK